MINPNDSPNASTMLSHALLEQYDNELVAFPAASYMFVNLLEASAHETSKSTVDDNISKKTKIPAVTPKIIQNLFMSKCR